ncbi:MAG: hypothetical protein GWM98_22155 [Nitrospinaceae bacterium]|nr:hypothetical protein [Nitrospinaceae bacterium]NIR56661.1 hypothetical protein [Nitrospinaceae bacterium]NIS87124.1 hypothetical protein [Nitrospinaceae bacterium]NIT83978.1 hypothetical protein [Nitrospinaceae bacterium]NIU46168.1 hypothetical protein [Nitrospinaceae bacterium]
MKIIRKVGLLGLLAGLVFMVPHLASADPKSSDPCAHHKDKDQLNLCRAFEIDKAKTDEQKKNRYQNKDHSTYYCSLIKNRDLQTYCYAVASKTKSQCGNIINAELEKKCNSKF